MKIPFTLDAWLKDKSQKVETRDGRLVHNIWQIKEPHYTNNRKAEVCALIDGEEDALVFFEGGRYLPTNKDTDNPFDLFIITPEPELSEFEQEVRVCVTKNLTTHIKDGNGREMSSTVFIDDGTAKKLAAELLELAKKELCEGWEITDWYERGKAVALRTHAMELTKYLANSGLDKDSIPYHLIEFMCNLYTCQNWKEVEETAEAYVTRVKAAAMKDLPRWKPAAVAYDGDRLPRIDWSLNRLVARFEEGIYYLDIKELYKLPGFNE